MDYNTLTGEQLQAEFNAVKAQYQDFCSRGLSLDMSRGKPSTEQLDLSDHIYGLIGPKDSFHGELNMDSRNYGCLDGLPELKRLFGQILGVDAAQVIVGGNSSLNMMFDTVAQAVSTGFGGEPWARQAAVKFICPSPGYDRHFAICEHFGIEMIAVENTKDGPDMDRIEALVQDPTVKGLWCVPKYSNPDGIVYSDSTVRRIARLKPAAADFRVYWDNAYAIHDLYEEQPLLNIYEECLKAGNPNLVLQFCSTSKITFSGAGVAAQAAGPQDIARLKSRLSVQTIGPDKINQLRHARLFPNTAALQKHMAQHAAILRPKFNAVLQCFERELGPLNLAEWTRPRGGYFISLNVPDGFAARTYELCKKAGLTLTAAGATYPYGRDPKNRNLRIAPSYPSVQELTEAATLLCVCVKYAVLESKVAE